MQTGDIHKNETYSRSALLRHFALKFSRLRLRIELIRDQFCKAIDYTIPSRFGEFCEFDARTMGFACFSSRKTTSLLRRFPEATLFAGGDNESAMHIPNAIFERFARAAGVRTRRIASQAQRDALRKARETLRVSRISTAHKGIAALFRVERDSVV